MSSYYGFAEKLKHIREDYRSSPHRGTLLHIRERRAEITPAINRRFNFHVDSKNGIDSTFMTTHLIFKDDYSMSTIILIFKKQAHSTLKGLRIDAKR